jgi:CheY-like chemotaxis protein
VLLDYTLPGMDGGMVADALKAYAPNVPVVMVSAAEVPEQCLSICDGHVQKGDGSEPLLRVIRQLLFPSVTPAVGPSQQVS